MATQAGDHAQQFSLAGIPFPITLRPAVRLSDKQLLAFSLNNRVYRMERNVQGEIEIMPPVGGDGSRWEAYVIREVDLWAEEHGGVSFSSNGGFSLPDGSMLSPDAAWVSQTRWDALTEEQRCSFPPLCPDFVIEVLSASDSRPVLRAKMQAWLANGAKLAWMIDPRAGEFTVLRRNEEVQVLIRPETVRAGNPVDGFQLHAARFWKQ